MSAALLSLLTGIPAQHGCHGVFGAEQREASLLGREPRLVYTSTAAPDDRADDTAQAIETAARELEHAGRRVEREGGYGLTDARLLGAGIPLIAFTDLGAAYTLHPTASPLDDPAAEAWARDCERRWAAWDREHRPPGDGGGAKRSRGIEAAQAHADSWDHAPRTYVFGWPPPKLDGADLEPIRPPLTVAERARFAGWISPESRDARDRAELRGAAEIDDAEREQAEAEAADEASALLAIDPASR